MKGLSPRQQDVYDYIEKFRDENGFPPTYGEIAEALVISIPASFSHIKAMQMKGFLTYLPGCPRTIQLTK